MKRRGCLLQQYVEIREGWGCNLYALIKVRDLSKAFCKSSLYLPQREICGVLAYQIVGSRFNSSISYHYAVSTFCTKPNRKWRQSIRILSSHIKMVDFIGLRGPKSDWGIYFKTAIIFHYWCILTIVIKEASCLKVSVFAEDIQCC